jgi:hypothetical protein
VKRNELITNIIIGAFGAVGQAVLLAHVFEAYPYKILNYPPARFYFWTGWVVALMSPFLAVLMLVIFRSTKRPFVTAIPVVACPLIFEILFRLVFALSGYHLDNSPQVSDVIATTETESDFWQLVLWLTGLGFVVGSLCGLAIQRFYDGRQNGFYTSTR